MSEILKGRAWVFGDDVDTDLIYHNKYLAETDPKNMPQYAFEYFPGKEHFAKEVKPGDFVVAGKNFGCGSSREHAPIALMNMGASVVLADSFARIFYRNAINLGLPLIICKDLSKKLRNGDEIEVNVADCTILFVSTGELLQGEKIGEHALNILNSGGIKPMYLKRMQEKLNK